MTPSPTDAPAFWACPKCKTPNPWASYLTHCVSCGGPRPARQAAVAFVPPKPEPPSTKPRPGARILGIFSCGYLAIVLIALGAIKLLGERWWPATVLLFAPRWAFLSPIPLLALWAGWRRRWRALAVQGITAAVVLGPLMGLRLPVGRLFSIPPDGDYVRILSLNRGNGPIDSKAFVKLLEDGRYDVVCIQESRPDPVLDPYFATTGWHRNHNGAIWSRLPIVKDLGSLSTEDYEVHGIWPVRLSRIRIRLAGGREVVVANAHMPTMIYAFEGLAKGNFRLFHYYVDWRSRQVDKLEKALHESGTTPVIVGGDFNMPPDSPFMGHLREHFVSGFEEVGWGYGYTRPSHACWAGIDRILASRDCHFVSSKVGPLVGSDHRPIDAEIVVLPEP